MPGGVTKFQPTWLEATDLLGNLISTWCEPGKTEYEAYCNLCCCRVQISNSGISQLRQHSDVKKHRIAAKRPKGQMKLFGSCNSSVSVAGGEPSCANKSTGTLSLQLSDNHMVARAEAIWVMKVAQSNYSFASCKDIVPILQTMFEGHPVAKQMQLSDRKVSYVLSHGLGPHFQEEVINELKKSSNWFTLAFDETTTCQVKKQLDVYIKFWSEKCSQVVNAYINSIFLGHADAEKICTSLINTLNDIKLPLSKVLMLSMDGPNVNLSVAKKMNQQLALENSPELVAFGTCTLHKVHNSFSKAISSLSLDIDQFANDIFGFFKLSAARREDLSEIQKLLDCEQKFALRHVNSRWLTLGPVISRIIAVYPSLNEYFLKFLPQQKNFSPLQQNSRYRRIATMLKDPATLAYLEFVSDLIPTLESYLALFQNEGPVVHLLHNKMNELLRNIMNKFVKQSCISTYEGKDLVNIDIDDFENLKPIKDLDIGISARRTISKFKESDRTTVRFEIRKCLSTLAKSLRENLPLSNSFLKDLEILHPLMRKDSSDNAVMRLCCKMKPLNLIDSEIDNIVREWQLYRLDEDIEVICNEFMKSTDAGNDTKYERVDIYWSKIFRLNDKLTGSKKYDKLSKLVKPCLSLSHGNADVERGFSINNAILSPERASLSEKSIIGLRLVKDAIRRHGNNILNIPITLSLLNAVTKSHSAYKEDKDQEAARAKGQKRAAQSESEQLKKKSKIDTKEKLTDMENYVKSLKSDLNVAQDLLNEGNKRLQKAIKKKDYKEMNVCSAMIESGTNKVKVLTEKLAEAERKSKRSSEA